MTLQQCLAFAAAMFAALFFSAAHAESPDRKNRLSGQEVVDIYLGKTWIWSKGGSYWGSGGQFEAIWENDAVALGKWYATSRGQLCYEVKWYSASAPAGRETKRCWSHVRDSRDRLWKEDEENGWYRPTREIAERVQDGNQIRTEVSKRRQELGI